MVPYCNLNHKVSDDSMSVFIKPWSDYNSHQSSCLSYPAETAPDTQTWKKGINCTLNTSLTAVINSGPTPSPGNMVTLKVASARAGGASGPQSAAETLSGREACGHRGLFRPWRRGEKRHKITITCALGAQPLNITVIHNDDGTGLLKLSLSMKLPLMMCHQSTSVYKCFKLLVEQMAIARSLCHQCINGVKESEWPWRQ